METAGSCHSHLTFPCARSHLLTAHASSGVARSSGTCAQPAAAAAVRRCGPGQRGQLLRLCDAPWCPWAGLWPPGGAAPRPPAPFQAGATPLGAASCTPLPSNASFYYLRGKCSATRAPRRGTPELHEHFELLASPGLPAAHLNQIATCTHKGSSAACLRALCSLQPPAKAYSKLGRRPPCTWSDAGAAMH